MTFNARKDMDHSISLKSPQISPPGVDEWSQFRLVHAHPFQASGLRQSRILASSKTRFTFAGTHSLVQPLVQHVHNTADEHLEILVDYPHSLDPRSLSKGGNRFACGYAGGIGKTSTDRDFYNENKPTNSCLYPEAFQRPRFDPSSTRSLTALFNVSCEEMATVVSAPGSPPDLSESRSSKSSSYASDSQFSNSEAVITDSSNFEEIGLEDDKTATSTAESYSANTSRTTKRPIAPRLKTAGPWANQSFYSPRDVSVRRPAVPNPQNQLGRAIPPGFRGPIYPVAPRNTDFVKRTFTSPSLPSLSASNGLPRTRSTSPVRHSHNPTSSTGLGVSGSSLQPISPRSSLPVSRRGSWQPNRKSIQELEAEYHDSDDELPEDAILSNVPVSPRPPEERISPRSSHHGSPERESGPRPIPLSHAVTAPDAPFPRSPLSSSISIPKTRPPPRTSSLNSTATAVSTPSSPNTRKALRHTRARSWTLAISELSEEAKVLSENLERHAEMTERAHEERVQNGNRLSLEIISNRSSFRSSSIQLPPVQKSTLDFMPISKEKEAVLSRTRPSWLPPKDPREEQKHLKEYQRMMAASLEAEKKREAKLYMKKCQKDDTRAALNKMWERYVEPSVDIATSHEEVRELWWRGVSPRVRGQVWQRAIGNQLALTDASYTKALQRAKDIQARDRGSLTEKEKLMSSWFNDIERDAETAFPELNLFQRGGPLWQDVVDVCEAYSCYRSDVGYVYGMQLIAALLLLQLHTPSGVFNLLANCLNRPMELAFMTNDRGSTSRSYDFAMSTLAIKFPRLHGYLFGFDENGGLGMGGEEVFEPMFRTLFSNGLDVDRLSRIWDCWVFDGDRTLVRTAVAVLGCLQNQIFDIDGDVDTRRRNIQELLGWGPYGRTGGYWAVDVAGDQDAFMEEVREAGKLDYTGR